MNRAKLNFAVDSLLLVSFLISAVTGLVLFIYLPPGSRLGQLSFLGINKLVWIKWHNISSLVFIAVVVIHFALHFKWYLTIAKSWNR